MLLGGLVGCWRRGGSGSAPHVLRREDDPRIHMMKDPMMKTALATTALVVCLVCTALAKDVVIADLSRTGPSRGQHQHDSWSSAGGRLSL